MNKVCSGWTKAARTGTTTAFPPAGSTVSTMRFSTRRPSTWPRWKLPPAMPTKPSNIGRWPSRSRQRLIESSGGRTCPVGRDTSIGSTGGNDLLLRSLPVAACGSGHRLEGSSPQARGHRGRADRPTCEEIRLPRLRRLVCLVARAELGISVWHLHERRHVAEPDVLGNRSSDAPATRPGLPEDSSCSPKGREKPVGQATTQPPSAATPSEKRPAATTSRIWPTWSSSLPA